MPAHDEFKKEIQTLMEQGQSFDEAWNTVKETSAIYEEFANKSDQIVKLKHKIRLEIRNIY